VATHRAGIEAAAAESVTILDAPFGFQENVEHLTARLVDFFHTSLRVSTEVASLRRPDASALEIEKMLASVRRSRYVFAGPGSPSYALKVWQDTGLAGALRDVILGGGTVTFASAAALTLGTATIPVYEIYKVGEDPYWLPGLDVTSGIGLPVTIIPHWNNAEGGNHDTSRCYIGERRLRMIEPQLETGILGVDEHSAVTIDLDAERITASGVGGVTLRADADHVLAAGDSMELAKAKEILGVPPGAAASVGDVPSGDVLLGDVPSGIGGFLASVANRDADAAAAAVLAAEESASANPSLRPELRTLIVRLAEVAREGLTDPRESLAPLVHTLLELRASARTAGRYGEADLIRDRLTSASIEVRDTPDGTEWNLRT
jgi:cyanophycinase-like exopeptidase